MRAMVQLGQRLMNERNAGAYVSFLPAVHSGSYNTLLYP